MGDRARSAAVASRRLRPGDAWRASASSPRRCYATAVALRAGSLARTGSRLLSVGEERYHLLARNMTDVITRHGRNGAVLFVSPAAEPLFGASPRELARPRPVRSRSRRRPSRLSHGADRCSHARRGSLGRVPRPPRPRRAQPPGHAFHLGRDALPAAGPCDRRGQQATAATSSRSCARSPTARCRSRRSRRRAARRSAPTPPRAGSWRR